MPRPGASPASLRQRRLHVRRPSKTWLAGAVRCSRLPRKPLPLVVEGHLITHGGIAVRESRESDRMIPTVDSAKRSNLDECPLSRSKGGSDGKKARSVWFVSFLAGQRDAARRGAVAASGPLARASSRSLESS